MFHNNNLQAYDKCLSLANGNLPSPVCFTGDENRNQLYSVKVIERDLVHVMHSLDIMFISQVKAKLDGVFLKVPHFATSVYKSTKHFGINFAHDALNIWKDLPDDLHSATFLYSFRKKLKTYMFAQAYPP